MLADASLILMRWSADMTGYDEPGGAPDCGMQIEGWAQPLSYVERWTTPTRGPAHPHIDERTRGKRQPIRSACVQDNSENRFE